MLSQQHLILRQDWVPFQQVSLTVCQLNNTSMRYVQCPQKDGGCPFNYITKTPRCWLSISTSWINDKKHVKRRGAAAWWWFQHWLSTLRRTVTHWAPHRAWTRSASPATPASRLHPLSHFAHRAPECATALFNVPTPWLINTNRNNIIIFYILLQLLS